MIINNVEYREIPGYPDYYAGYDGTIYSGKSDKLRKPNIDKDGYLQVTLLSIEHKNNSEKVHRLVALAWLPNPDGKPQVHHKDEDTTNNSVDNLAWVTAKENINAGTRTRRMAETNRKPVVLTNVTDGTKLYFSSVTEAMSNGYRVDHVLSGQTKTTKGYYVEYV